MSSSQPVSALLSGGVPKSGWYDAALSCSAITSSCSAMPRAVVPKDLVVDLRS